MAMAKLTPSQAIQGIAAVEETVAVISFANSCLLCVVDGGHPFGSRRPTIGELSETKIGKMPRQLNLRTIFTLITLFVLPELSLFGQTGSSIKNVFWQPNELQPGSVTFFTAELNREATKV